MPTLDQLARGRKAEILSIQGEPGLVQRLYELGFLEGDTVELVGRAPLGDPIEVRIGNSCLTLRNAEASGIAVRPLD